MTPRIMRFEEITAPGGRRPISENGNEKARGRSPGAGHVFRDDAPMPVICPTCQFWEKPASLTPVSALSPSDNSGKIAKPESLARADFRETLGFQNI